MIELLADRIRDPLFQDIYIGVGVAIMVLPMVALTYWYHGTVNRTEGGRALMAENENYRTSGRLGPSIGRNLRGANSMMRDISAGRYGEEVRRLQNRTYVYVLSWVAANIVVFGALIWAQDYNQRRDAAAGGTATTTSEPARQ